MNQHSPHRQPEAQTAQSARPALWKSIHEALSADISEGRYRPGDKLPTEAALSRRFGVNRHTVRRALRLLAEDGVVHARRGAGVFVTQEATEYPIGKRVRFHQNLRAAGRLPAKEVLTMETRAATADEAEALQLEAGALVHVYEGLSLADAQPIALFRSVFPAARLPDLPEALTRLRSVTAALAEAGVADYTRAWTRLNAKLATPTQARHLHLPDGAPLLRTVSLNIDAKGCPLEYGRTWFSGDLVTLTVSE
ncbi:MAG: phosphonate metabolism transcriptional regulator PhnF [Roseovarius sp.]